METKTIYFLRFKRKAKLDGDGKQVLDKGQPVMIPVTTKVSIHNAGVSLELLAADEPFRLEEVEMTIALNSDVLEVERHEEVPVTPEVSPLKLAEAQKPADQQREKPQGDELGKPAAKPEDAPKV